jgi:DNA-binding protein H-NS
VSVLEKLKSLEKEAGKLRKQAKKEAMAAVKAALNGLNSLGHSFHLVERTKDGPFPAKKGRAVTKKVTRKRDPNAKCKVCGETGHDARRHRWDKKKKK